MAKPKKKDWRNLTLQERLEADIREKEQLSDRVSRWRERVDEEIEEEVYDPSKFEDYPLGTVINMRSSHHYVRLEQTGEVVDCMVPGNLKRGVRNTTTVVAPGDKVHIERLEDGNGLIVEIVPRNSTLSRPDPYRSHLEDIIVANLDQVLIVSSVGGPAFWPELLDRYLVYCEYYELKAVPIVNKIDLVDPEKLEPIRNLYQDQLGYEILFTSAETGAGIDRLKESMADRISVIVGLSGVGKSSLLNGIQPDLNLKVQSVNETFGGEGKHTTRTVILHHLDIGGFVADTPGIRAFGLWDLTPEEVDYYFIEFRDYIGGCKFSDCTHHHEPKCAIREAVENGEIAESRYKSFLVLFEETDPAMERPF